MLRQLFQTSAPSSQPFVISGSGTLGWDVVAANLAEPGDEVLVLHTGYFADSFADCFKTYSVKATQLKAPIGEAPPLSGVENALTERNYKLLTVTHVDTSTGVLSEIKSLAQLVRRVSPNTLIIVDGVCSVGCEEIRFDDWDLDVVLTASQKAIGCPAGLCILMCSGRAIETLKARKSPSSSYFASMENWLPSMLNPLLDLPPLMRDIVMQNYEARKPSYFATPPTQLIQALHTALSQILSRPLAERFAAHREASARVKATIESLGLKQLPAPENQANGMTAIYLPTGVKPTDLLPVLLEGGVCLAGGLHKAIASKYIRFGHMGVSVTDPGRSDISKALETLKLGLVKVGYSP